MNLPHSDALVFFGATGDLIFKKVFPSLYLRLRQPSLAATSRQTMITNGQQLYRRTAEGEVLTLENTKY